MSVDYGFTATANEASPRTMLVMQAGRSKAIMARIVQGKGRADPSAVGWATDQLRRLGVGRCILLADGEPAQRAFVKDVVDEVCRTSAIGVAPAHTRTRPSSERSRGEGRSGSEGPGPGHDERLVQAHWHRRGH